MSEVLNVSPTVMSTFDSIDPDQKRHAGKRKSENEKQMDVLISFQLDSGLPHIFCVTLSKLFKG